MNRLLLFFALLLATGNANAQTYSISGTFSLPGGIVAPSGGAEFKISTDPLETFEVGGGSLESSATVIIPAFFNGGSYSLTLRDAPEPAETQPPTDPNPKKLMFECVSGCDSLGAITSGYWSITAGVVDADQATEFPATQNATVNILLPRGDVFSGVVKLPEGFLATGDEQITVTIKGNSFSNPPTFSQLIETEEDENEWPFRFVAPRNLVGGWFMELSCVSCDENIPVEAHLPTTALGDPMTLDGAQDFFFIRFRTYSNMVMTFISTKEEPELNAASVIGAMSILLDEEEE